mgnify:CR=1 FL=1
MKCCSKCGKEIDEKKGICENCGNQQKKKNKKLPKWAIILIIVGAALFLFMLLGDSTTQPKYDENGDPVYVENGKLDYLYSDTYEYLGQFVDISGKIFSEPETDGEFTILQIWADPENAEKNTIIYYNGKLDVKTDDYVKLTGYVYDVMDYENTFGGTMSAPVIMATKIEKGSYADVMSPTLKEVNYTDKSINQHNYKIEVTKVEFAEKETRIYLTAKNDAKDEFSIYTYSAVITQNGKQYEQDDNWDADYEEVQSELKPGITSSGILVFPKIEQKDFKLIIDGSSDDWDIDINEYVFNLEVK